MGPIAPARRMDVWGDRKHETQRWGKHPSEVSKTGRPRAPLSAFIRNRPVAGEPKDGSRLGGYGLQSFAAKRILRMRQSPTSTSRRSTASIHFCSALMLACLVFPAISVSQELNSGSTAAISRDPKSDDINKNIYYKNRLDFSFETGCLPLNIPFPFDFLTSGAYTKTPLQYTLVPAIASIRWQPFNVNGRGMLRGSWDFSAGASFTAIPRGPETRSGYFILGLRRSFVPRHWRSAPFFDGRVGTGFINAKEPDGVQFAQGQDFTFTLLLGSGVRYNFNSRYGVSGGVSYMHVSNLYLSEPRFPNYGINVYGPMIGFTMRVKR